ncbi:PaaI family thioesterase [Limnobacter sp.]|uniref:PaaI family thioesterase n=1 Tax=Limnobacter sp. TaxID=2003368 RepID=UPI00391C3EDF
MTGGVAENSVVLSEDLSPVVKLFSPIRRSNKDGKDCYELLVTEQHLNKAGTFHGGFYCTVFDIAMGSTATDSIDSIKKIATVNLNVSLIRAAFQGDTLNIRVSLLRKTERLIYLSAEMFSKESLLANATSTIYYVANERISQAL